MASILSWFKKLVKKDSFEYRTVYEEKHREELSQEQAQNMTVGEIKGFINQAFPPYAWARIGMRLYQEFLKHGIHFSRGDEDKPVPPELVKQIDETLQNIYGKGLPK